jgi:hypothetical protein
VFYLKLVKMGKLKDLYIGYETWQRNWKRWVRWWFGRRFGGPNGYFDGPRYEFKIILTEEAKKAFKELFEWLMRPWFPK